jgi:hypothetical protein
MIEPTTIDAKGCVVFPITPLTPTTPDQQQWVAVLSGIAVFELQGAAAGWIQEEVRLTLDEMLQSIFTIAQRTPSAGHHLRFVVEHAANFAALNSTAVSSGSQQGEFGFAVDNVETNLIGHTIHCFDGLTIKVAVRGEHRRLLRVGFQSTLSGWIREFRTRDV